MKISFTRAFKIACDRLVAFSVTVGDLAAPLTKTLFSERASRPPAKHRKKKPSAWAYLMARVTGASPEEETYEENETEDEDIGMILILAHAVERNCFRRRVKPGRLMLYQRRTNSGSRVTVLCHFHNLRLSR